MTAALLIGGPVLAQDRSPEASLLPPQKPAAPETDTDGASQTGDGATQVGVSDPPSETAPDDTAQGDEATSVPEDELEVGPEDEAAGISPPAPVAGDPANGLATTHAPATGPTADETAAFRACTEALSISGAVFEPVDTVTDENDAACGVTLPVRLAEAAPGVALNPDTILQCEAALALSKWVQRTVLPASDVLAERGDVTGLNHGSSYICRRRNNLPDEVLSEHSFGSAIDIMGVTFRDGSSLTIEPRERDGTLEEAFQDAVRAGACLYFTTVLGPGSDESHADHLHFDIKTRPGGFRLCQ